MSIAVSAVIKPSKILMVLIGSAYLFIAFIGWWFIFAEDRAPSSVWLVSGAVYSVLIVICGIAHIIRLKKSLHIDISGNGQIKVEEYYALATVPRKKRLEQERETAKVVKLMPQSTLWPFLLLLRLQAGDRRMNNVLILPDCMSAESFRALSVACRWIAAHNDHAERKIL